MLRQNFKHCLTWKRKRFGCIKSSQIMLIFVPLHILSMRWTWSTTLRRCIQRHDLLTGRKRRKTRAMQHAKHGLRDFTQGSWNRAPLLTAVNFLIFFGWIFSCMRTSRRWNIRSERIRRVLHSKNQSWPYLQRVRISSQGFQRPEKGIWAGRDSTNSWWVWHWLPSISSGNAAVYLLFCFNKWRQTCKTGIWDWWMRHVMLHNMLRPPNMRVGKAGRICWLQ